MAPDSASPVPEGDGIVPQSDSDQGSTSPPPSEPDVAQADSAATAPTDKTGTEPTDEHEAAAIPEADPPPPADAPAGADSDAPPAPTDSVAPANYNLKLSQQRAEVVRDFLLKQGVAEHQIHIDWKGEAEPVASNDTEDGRLLNRRTEITLGPASAQQSQRTHSAQQSQDAQMTRKIMTAQ